ncbi:YwaF family protein [Streptococcus sp. A12]|uniref:YwaF family protein n=1 Tax=Streptococcus sp. A12 TaxID=1759399 RepID=UPI0025CDA94B|nr:YwaF family protein [Streptococcus sp. A12]
MTLWDLFFTSQPTAPPQLGAWYFLLPTSLVVVGLLSIRFASSKCYQNFWYWGQLIQLLIINAWYIAARLPFSESLPFYHSRMAMWIILFAPRGRFKQYFALVGVFVSIMALVHPVFYPYPFPHVSSINNVFGHWALLANCLIYLVQSYQVEARDAWKICQMTFGVNAIIQLANLVTCGNYGFMRRPPVLGDHGLVLNYLIVTILMTGTLILINAIVKSSKKRKKHLNPFNKEILCIIFLQLNPLHHLLYRSSGMGSWFF